MHDLDNEVTVVNNERLEFVGDTCSREADDGCKMHANWSGDSGISGTKNETSVVYLVLAVGGTVCHKERSGCAWWCSCALWPLLGCATAVLNAQADDGLLFFDAKGDWVHSFRQVLAARMVAGARVPYRRVPVGDGLRDHLWVAAVTYGQWHTDMDEFRGWLHVSSKGDADIGFRGIAASGAILLRRGHPSVAWCVRTADVRRRDAPPHCKAAGNDAGYNIRSSSSHHPCRMRAGCGRHGCNHRRPENICDDERDPTTDDDVCRVHWAWTCDGQDAPSLTPSSLPPPRPSIWPSFVRRGLHRLGWRRKGRVARGEGHWWMECERGDGPGRNPG